MFSSAPVRAPAPASPTVAASETAGLQIDPEASQKLVKLGVAKMLPPAALIQNITFSGDMHRAYLNIFLNRKVLYTIATNAKRNELILTLQNTFFKKSSDCHPLVSNEELPAELKTGVFARDCSVESSLPDTTGSAINKLQLLSNDGNEVKLKLYLADGTELRKLVLTEERLPKLMVEVGNISSINNAYTANISQSTDEAVAQNMSIQPSAESEEDPNKVDENYQKASLLVQEQRVPEAVSLLKQALSFRPEDVMSRKLLAMLLLQQEKIDEANMLVQEGLRQEPNNPVFTNLSARILIQQGNPKKALEVLQKANPPLETDPDYYALKAAVQQQLGEFISSAQLYGKLLVLKPSNGVWWMGLGIAMEKTGHRLAAMQSYQKATMTATLNPQLQIYVEDRLKALGG